MKKIKLVFIFIISVFSAQAQNISVNTTGAANSTLSMLEVLQISTTASTKGLHVAHSGVVVGTSYGIWSEKTGASTTNIAGYFSASGGTNNYALIVPASSGFVGIGTLVPTTLFHVDGGTATTTQTAATISVNSLTTGRGLNITSSSTAGTASGSSYLLYLNRSGANTNTAHNAYGLYSTVTNTNATSGTNIGGYFTAGGATTANFGVRGINTSAISGSAGVHGNGVANADGYLGYVLPTTSFGAVSAINPGGYFTGNGNTPLTAVSNGATSALIVSSMSATGGRAGNFSIENPNADGIRVVHNAATGAGTGSGIYTTTRQSDGGCLVGWNFNTSGTGVLGGGNNVASISYLVAGSGAAFTGSTNGCVGNFPATTGSGGAYSTPYNGIRGHSNASLRQVASADAYQFGTYGQKNQDFGGTNYYDLRSGGVLGLTYRQDNLSIQSWGALGYKTSGAGTNYGLYAGTGGSSTAAGTGRYASGNTEQTFSEGVGGGLYGGLMGSWSRGKVMGSASYGQIYAHYNIGNEYTSGCQADIVTVGDNRVAAYSMTSTDLKIYNDGYAKLNNGKARIIFSNEFAELLLKGYKPVITVTPAGNCNGVYLSDIDSRGFSVVELNNGKSNVEIGWIAIGRRADANENTKLPDDLADIKFDENMKGVMFNELIPDQGALPIWWDGTKLHFEPIPVELEKNLKPAYTFPNMEEKTKKQLTERERAHD